ncbi:glucose-6-phosphate isomerase [Desulfurivibrio alkaliphilus]|uniref:Glucose-6-phosphate isomerase n=1 Tax=Desulfurivibrio alkaliphilus (strain DSM 19089 / UNIQEM U267 / AHT2) TaxID=589865 RepID=D6Z567_DESAT|nr:glucose-6-phosphate isomerase [Desulfurivibrio alkaliphilus]ADH84724.1 Glucose-6-phosphate isomerase [Desulfurivibrio alkaliphilus AHT 2]
MTGADDYLVDFTSYKSYSALRSLAAEPFNLKTPGVMSPERIAACRAVGGGFELLFFGQRVARPELAALQELADEARLVEQFAALRRGAVFNRIAGFASEERQVLHCSCRDIFRDRPAEPHATAQAKAELDKLQQFLADLDQGRLTTPQGEPFTGMIQIGIGGSDLGPRALYLALQAYAHPDRRVEFISNVDPDDAARVLKEMDLSRTLVNVVSKSGTTLETLANEELVRRAYRQAGLDPNAYFVAVTGQGSPMDNPANYLRSFYMFDYIGGRYSATSMVGLVMLGFALGYEPVQEILQGAHAADEAAMEPDIMKNPALLLALLGIWNRNFLRHESLAVLPYSQALVRFAAHLQQLDMESNGKSIDRRGQALNWDSGPIVWGEPGTNGQHAFYQLLHQGTGQAPAEFIGFRHSQYGQDLEIQETTAQEKLLANLLAQSLALAVGQDDPNPNRRFPGNRPSSILLADRLTPERMGALLALYEAKVVFQGFVWNINSFDQEGVQLGKRLANRLLEQFAARRRGENPPEDPVGQALLKNAGL